MASINGITIHKLKSFKGHEGETCFQGDIYLLKEKIAFWSQSYHDAIDDDIDMCAGYSESRFRNAIIAANKEKAIHGRDREGHEYQIDYSLEFLMEDLVKLHDMEKQYKREKAKGYIGILVSSDNYHFTIWSIPPKDEGKDILKEYAADLEDAHKSFFKNAEITDCYYTADSFRVGEAIKKEDICIK